MGKPLIVQRRGKGSPTYRAPSHRYFIDLKYRKYDDIEKNGVIKGKVIDIFHVPERTAPLAEVKLENGEKLYVLCCEGLKVGDTIEIGAKATPKPGNILPLYAIPVGSHIFNIEINPGDGGKLVRAAGTSALLISKDEEKVIVQLPSGKLKELDPKCRATIGIVAGGGRKDKPFLKAGKKYHALRSKATYWPVPRGTAMNPVDHPHGGGSRRPGKPTTVSRHAPPGQKVGLIAARRTGRKKK